MYSKYLKGRQVQQGKTVEETNPLQSHLNDSGVIEFLSWGSHLWHETMQEDTVQGMYDSHQICGLQQGRQSGRVLVLIVKYVWSTAEEDGEKIQVHVHVSSVFNQCFLTLHIFASQFG